MLPACFPLRIIAILPILKQLFIFLSANKTVLKDNFKQTSRFFIVVKEKLYDNFLMSIKINYPALFLYFDHHKGQRHTPHQCTHKVNRVIDF